MDSCFGNGLGVHEKVWGLTKPSNFSARVGKSTEGGGKREGRQSN
jgi:hypothetical protein